MAKKTFLLLSSVSISLFPISTLSCQKYPNDDENLNLDESRENKKYNKKFIFQNAPTKKIIKIFNEETTNLFTQVKQTYRSYRKDYINIVRKLSALSAKVLELINEQGNHENSEKINDFYLKWLEPQGENKCELAKIFDKYTLIFQDVDAVLNDVNLVFDNQEFPKYLQVIDDRLSGKDINLGSLQKAIISSWEFLKNHVYNEEKLSKIEDVDKINIESDKNSHSHSHAIINLTFEMGLWHLILSKNLKLKEKIEEFKNDFEVLRVNVVENIGQKNYEDDFNYLIRIFEGDLSFNSTNNIVDSAFRSNAKQQLDKIKNILISIVQNQGLDRNIIK
ncbi:HxHSH motif-containing lipoprotein [Mycoplasmopsis opalescens]|uniref:HxHSH motif-containing lipoprotein n=1 Tax=Mycoplasmopsis opalescens TaxID=114886 RepID=UPI0004A760A1|nr:hypothetical protein [Mycoplasmopsis opalescens]